MEAEEQGADGLRHQVADDNSSLTAISAFSARADQNLSNGGTPYGADRYAATAAAVAAGAGQPNYPGSAPPPVAYPPHMMRPQQPELVRMPQGPTPAEWAAQQQRALKEGNPPTPASIPAPSPAASSVADESMDDKSRLESPSWSNQGQVGPPTAANPPRVMPERRMFFERLVQFCEQHGEPITMIPQVSKQNVDLHRLYIGVRNRGGFEQVTKDKAWKAICTEANPEISQSSAAGYQLRKHYEKHLLLLECVETGRRPEDANSMKMSPNASPYAQYALNYYHHQSVREREREAYYRSRNMMLPQSDWRPYGPPHAQPPPSQDPALYYQQQQQQAAAHGFPPGTVPAGPPGAPGTYPASAYPPRLPPSTAPMRAPHPQPHMMDNASQAGSRAPSTGPAASAASPDSSSRMSAGVESTEQRPGSAAVGTPAAAHTPGPHSVPQPSTSMAAVGPPGQPAGTPQPPAASFYGQPAPMYPNGPARLPAGYPGGYPYHPAHPSVPPGHPGGPPPQQPPQFAPAPHPAAHPAHPQHQQYMQQQQYAPQPPQPQQAVAPQQQQYPPRPPQISASYPPVATQTAPAPTSLVPPPMSFSHQHHFPHGSVEATVISQKRRRKIMARELINCSRTGRKIKVLEAEMPELLKRKLMLEEGPSCLPIDETLTSDYVEERIQLGLGGGLAERVALRLRTEWHASKTQSRARFSCSVDKDECSTEAKAGSSAVIKQEAKEETAETPEIVMLRRGRNSECCDEATEYEIRWPRATALTDRNETLQRFDAPLPEPESYETVRTRALSLLDCDDAQQVLLVETANQLRDDAFVMLCHMSVAVMQTHGMPALRDNPEMMGTSVGMLRRAAAMLRLLVKVPDAYRVYAKYQQRLLQFTMSQLMDSRVAGMIADALYEIQALLGKEKASNVNTNEANHNHDGDASVVVKSENVADDTSSSVSTDVATENVVNDDSASQATINGDATAQALKKTAMKRSGIHDDCVTKAPSSKRACLENGYEKKNGKLDSSPLKLKETRAENGSMTAVA
ncbi:ARID/BRIGHT DNA binding domain protein [Teladorsagia circumcincta]|uniref:ARID/BRIGHT DNA binding domain protein n=1 Tax=Teladorsagia circumcincta TaxID=45464 RepID=A0A2G9UWW7_TELCI|nr:ARID/BRIGHT DNA binding domain protein [Teladorsagia circumcincta]